MRRLWGLEVMTDIDAGRVRCSHMSCGKKKTMEIRGVKIGSIVNRHPDDVWFETGGGTMWCVPAPSTPIKWSEEENITKKRYSTSNALQKIQDKT